MKRHHTPTEPGVSAPDGVDAPFWTARLDAAAFTRGGEARMDRARHAIERLRSARGPRTLDNTLVPYDEAVLELDAAGAQASLLENVHPDPALRAAAERLTQAVADQATELSLDRGVYDALSALDLSAADAATRHYVEKTLREFRLSGVDRDDATRERVRALNDELVEISQQFARNIRSDVRTVALEDVSELDGMPADYVARHAPGPDGRITLTTEYPDATPVFLYARSEALRRRMFLEYNNRAFPVNLAVLDRMLARRHELATLLGFAHWADYVTANKMVGSAAAAAAFIDRIVEASGERATADHAALLARKREDDPAATTIAAWEIGFYAEEVRRSTYGFDAQVLRPYFPFERVKRGVLDLIGRLFDVRFERRADAPVWHPAVECWEMFEAGQLAGRFYLDMHPRADKYSHAAQFDIRTGVAGRQLPEAALICNFPAPSATDPGLLEYSEVRTLFHEFGHLMHALFAGRHRWAGVGGIRTEHDFIEVPSQLLEEWTQDPAVLATFSRHHLTGETIPDDLVRRMVQANGFGRGLQMRRQMVLARVSLSYHDRPPGTVDTDRIFAEVSERLLPIPYVRETHMQCSFGHLDGYSATYYTYMWSLVIAKDFFDRFDRADLLEPSAPRRYREAVLAPGGSRPALELVQEFLGRPFSFEAYRTWLNDLG